MQEPGDNCGGQTALVKNSELLARIDPEVASRFDAKGIRYWRFSQDKSKSNFLSWQEVFLTDSKEVRYGKTLTSRQSTKAEKGCKEKERPVDTYFPSIRTPRSRK